MTTQINDSVIKITIGHTKNLGNFEALKITVGVELPCNAQNMDEVYIKASDLVTEYVNAEFNKYGYTKD